MSLRTPYESRLAELQIELPPPPLPMATYVPAVRAGNLLFLSGVLPIRDGQLAFSGKLGRDLTVEQGMEAARLALLNALAIAKQEVGSLDRGRIRPAASSHQRGVGPLGRHLWRGWSSRTCSSGGGRTTPRGFCRN
jgi:hypothetical protein